MKRYISLVLALVLCLMVTSVSAVPDEKLQIYFLPHIMDDTTGEIVVDVNLKNTNLVIDKSYGNICSISFGFTFDTKQFNIKEDANGNVEFVLGGNSLIKDTSCIEASYNGNKIIFNFSDTSFSEHLIKEEGKLCSFTLIAKYPRELWNSFDTYPLRFIPGTVGVVTYNAVGRSVVSYSNLEAIDVNVGGYNKAPSLATPSLAKHITFTAGSTGINCDGVLTKTDAKAFFKGESFMVPFRYFADAAGMKVAWEPADSMAGAYCDYKTVKVSLKNKSVYINSVKCVPKALPVEIDGRTYISSDVIPEIFPGAVVNVNKDAGTAEIYIQ